jgi:hypothetical protein
VKFPHWASLRALLKMAKKIFGSVKGEGFIDKMSDNQVL